MNRDDEFGFYNCLKSVDKSEWSDLINKYLTLSKTHDFQYRKTIHLSFGAGATDDSVTSMTKMLNVFPLIVGPILEEFENSAISNGENINKYLELFVSQICATTLEYIEGTSFGIIAAVLISEENFLQKAKKYFQIAKVIAYGISENTMRDIDLLIKMLNELTKNGLVISSDELKLPVMIGNQNLQHSPNIMKDILMEVFKSGKPINFNVGIENGDYPISMETLSNVCKLINPLSLFEFKKILDFGKGPIQEVPYVCAHDAFEVCAQRDPECIAVEHEEQQITYGELNRRADCVAAGLIKRGVQSGSFVAIVTKRSIEMIIAIFGILKAGAAYVPIDMELPFNRIEYILETASCHTILCHAEIPQELIRKLPQDRIVAITDESMIIDCSYSKPNISGNDPVYAVFTSGSTGKPKGVIIRHSSLNNYSSQEPNILHAKKGDKIAQNASIGFDMAVGEIFATLSKNATLVLREEEDYLAALKKVNTSRFTPTALRKLNPADFPNLATICPGGEPFTETLLEKWQHIDVYNCYGPSETTINSSFARLKAGDQITIGKPMVNTVQYIVDSNLQLVPIGVPGELLIGGAGVALGYLNRPDLTAEKFIPNHFENDGTKMYRTGDMCKWTTDGKIEILGRMDDMVKVKGYRIELEEVILAVNSHPQVVSAT
ncbi:hypothetical protein HDV01_004293, partial [Terramyces sp. JEL0728]